jgi:glycosyltransferase involved in cell wall biosynthesis
MNENNYSFIILTFNEEMHLPRLLNSIQDLYVPIFILDSGSTDNTLKIAEKHKAIVRYNRFENHPKQWDFALNNFEINTPWSIGLDADHIVMPELFARLKEFENSDISDEVNGIYFNRKNYFQGKWIRHGGYFPKYLLKMFRTGVGRSDLNENMDHRFIVPGRTIIWKDGYIKEENLKENDINFWKEKHKRYSVLVAYEEIERRTKHRSQPIKPKLFGSPDERTAFQKKIWWSLPLFIRPIIYYIYRFIIQLGFLDGKKGWVFHYYQALWFRSLIDMKIWGMRKKGK